jgi:hypothetical protein
VLNSAEPRCSIRIFNVLAALHAQAILQRGCKFRLSFYSQVNRRCLPLPN